MLEAVRQRHAIQLPERTVQREVESLVARYAEQLSRQGVDLENVDVPWEKVAEQAKPEAEKRVHEQLVLDAIADEREIKVDEREVERVIADVASREGQSSLNMRAELDRLGRLAPLRAQIRRDQTVLALLRDAGGYMQDAEETEASEEA